ncbi:PPE family protein, SVP subgroup [Mycobacterium avium]|uniref:PPE family protein, SVP subgroup n=1 Tax=Mycobacterium avium TaxID=1764 RepID=UPI00398C80D1
MGRTLTSAVSPAVSEEGSAVQAAAGGAPGVRPNGLLRGMPVGRWAGAARPRAYVNKYGFRYSVLTRPPSAG